VAPKAPGEGIRAQLGHPVLDADGHTLEFGPLLSDYLRADGVADDLAGVFEGMPIFSTRWRDLSPEERRRTRAYRSVWWWHPTQNTKDLATAYLPGIRNGDPLRNQDKKLFRAQRGAKEDRATRKGKLLCLESSRALRARGIERSWRGAKA
jgi:hypothetical protein